MEKRQNAELIREKLMNRGFIGVAECECIGDGQMRYTLETKYEDQKPPCFDGDFIFITSDRFLDILIGYLSKNGDEIIAHPEDRYAIEILNQNPQNIINNLNINDIEL